MIRLSGSGTIAAQAYFSTIKSLKKFSASRRPLHFTS
jgi:hypothetical protein